MRILFLPWANASHYFPMAPLAWAARLAGHEVQIAGLRTVHDVVVQSGMTPLVVGERYDPVAEWDARAPEAVRLFTPPADGKPPTPQQRAELADKVDRLMGEPYIRTAEAMAEDLVPFVRSWRPDLVISDPLVVCAPTVAKVAGVPLVYSMDGTVVTPEFGFPGQRLYKGPFAPELVALAEKYGVAADEGRAVLNIDPCPDVLQAPGIPDRVPVRYVPYNGSGTVPAWLTEPPARPRVCVTRGFTTSQVLDSAQVILPQVFASLAELDVEVVATVRGGDESLQDAAGDVRVVTEMPLNILLPTCDLIIHQGGTGTMLTAALLGVPQITVTKIPGQVANGRQLANTGAGFCLHLDSFDPGELKATVEKALGEGPVRESAQALREQLLAQPSPAAEVIKVIEGL